jgi:flagellar protein FlaG
MLIERISSNQYSSQLRTTLIGEASTQTQELNHSFLPGTFIEDKQQNVTFTKEKVEEIVDSMNKFIQPSTTALKFEFHEKLNEYYVKIIDDNTKEVVREIPPKKLLDFYAAMTEFLGIMVDKKI